MNRERTKHWNQRTREAVYNLVKLFDKVGCTREQITNYILESHFLDDFVSENIDTVLDELENEDRICSNDDKYYICDC